MLFKDRLRQLIESSPLERKEISAYSHVQKRTVDKWMQLSESNPSAGDLVKLARTLNTTVEYLVLGEEGNIYLNELFSKTGVSAEHPPGLAEGEEELLLLFRRASEKKKAAIIELLKSCAEEKNELLESLPRAKIR